MKLKKPKESGSKSDFEETESNRRREERKQRHKQERKLKQKIERLNEDKKDQASHIYKLESESHDLESKLKQGVRLVEEEQRRFKLEINKNKELEKQIADLRETQHKLQESANEGLKHEMEDLRSRYTMVQNEKDRIVEELIQKEKRIGTYKDEIDKMHFQLDQHERDKATNYNRFNEQRDVNQKDLRRKNEELQTIGHENSKMVLQLENANIELKKLQTEYDRLTSKSTNQNYTKSQVDQENRDLEQVIFQQEQLINQLRQKLDEFETEEINAVSELKTQLQNISNEHEKIIEMYEIQLKLLKERLFNELKEMTLKHLGKGAKSTGKDGNTQNELNIELMMQISQREAAITSSRSEKKTLNGKINSFTTKVKKLKERISKLTSENESLQKKTTMKSIGRDKKIAQKEETNKGQLAKVNLVEYFSELHSISEIVKRNTQLEMQMTSMQNTLKLQELEGRKDSERAILLEEKLQSCISQLEGTQESKKLTKKEISEASKKYKQDIELYTEEIKQIKEQWISPENLEKFIKREKDLEIQLHSLREELNRKRELLNNIKSKDQMFINEKENMMIQVENAKDENEKLRRITKENSRKEQAINNLRLSLDSIRNNEKSLINEMSILQDTIKNMKIENTRKENLIRGYKEKIEVQQKDMETSKGKKSDFDKHKERIKRLDL